MAILIVGLVVKNEANRFLIKVLDTIKTFADKIVIIDDGSTDNTIDICKKYTDNIFNTPEIFIQNESILRKMLWEKCCELVEDEFNTWIAILDADELVCSDNILEELNYANETEANALGYLFYDMWNDTQYRSDDLWKAHTMYTVHIVRYFSDTDYKWNEKQLHCGRLPRNSFYNVFISKVRVKHLAYSTEKERLNKFKHYMALDKDGKFGSLPQYESIIDKNPNLLDF